jgi:hypothetical protein
MVNNSTNVNKTNNYIIPLIPLGVERHLFLDISMGFFLSAVDMCWFLLLAYICITVEISIIKRGACKIVYYPILPSHIYSGTCLCIATPRFLKYLL